MEKLERRINGGRTSSASTNTRKGAAAFPFTQLFIAIAVTMVLYVSTSPSLADIFIVA